jgi:hypothetical protein
MIRNELPQEGNLSITDRAPAVAIFDRHSSRVTENLFERKPLV